MTDTIDRDLFFRVKDVSDALNGRIDYQRFDAMVTRLIQAADHLSSASVGARMADQLADPVALSIMLRLFGQSERGLDNAALTLGTIGVHSALDLCAGVILAVVDGVIPEPGGREGGIPALRRRRSAAPPLPDMFADWVDLTVEDGRYDDLERWRDPQTHRAVPKAVFGHIGRDRVPVRGSVRVYGPRKVGDRSPEEHMGSASEKLPAFVRFGEERFLALTFALRSTYAPGWTRHRGSG